MTVIEEVSVPEAVRQILTRSYPIYQNLKIKEKLGHFIKGPLIHAAKLTLRMSPSAEMTSGIASYLTELLYRNGVNIYDAFLGYGDIIMVVDDRDGPQAYEILQREVNKQALKD